MAYMGHKAVVTGICHAKQAAMADYYRQFHIYFLLKGESGSELDRAFTQTPARIADMAPRFWQKLTHDMGK